MKDRTVKLASWMPIIVSIISVVLITLLLGLMDFNWSRVLTLSYWSETAITTIVGIFIYSYSYFTFIKKERELAGTSYKEAALLHYKYQKAIRENQLRDVLIPEVEKENERRKIDAISKIMAKYGLVYKNFINMRDSEQRFEIIEDVIEKRRFKKKKAKKFIKDLERCFYENLNYETIQIDDLLNDMDTDKDNVDSQTMVESSSYHRKTISLRLGQTLLISTLLAVLAIKSIFDSRWLEIILRNASIIGTNCVAASMKAKDYINYRKIILTNRNNFFSRCVASDLL